jgi:hypothetical protein
MLKILGHMIRNELDAMHLGAKIPIYNYYLPASETLTLDYNPSSHASKILRANQGEHVKAGCRYTGANLLEVNRNKRYELCINVIQQRTAIIKAFPAAMIHNSNTGLSIIITR